MLEQLNKEFKQDLKYGLNEDDDLTNLIKDGIAHIESMTGTNIDFKTNYQAKTLLKNYVRYAYNNATEYFDENFQRELLRLIFMEGVKANV